MSQIQGELHRVSRCVPIRDMKNTAAFTTLVEESSAPVTVTRNGYDAFVMMRSEDYEAMQVKLAQARLLSRLSRAEAEYASGDFVDGKEFTSRMRSEYGL
ncbi:type II toxin-antitoxin system Phd/YefM family antitoxin [Paraeggerthella sp. Marseille-Q4926]|uniref:type II toxin-antitoxin system Phd/YefM family antitoxin n=1 Tax=Paraeggerthella sp. Marseille-Q4926 TaxID=2866587 RepID=UPI001CE3CD6A|nr:type II toxin-antitoxin system Phd/YefM family antitoxin [Paraeggerthella sp. Marseille-Q4926]